MATIDDRNGQSTKQNFGNATDVDRLDNLLNSLQQSQKKSAQFTRQYTALTQVNEQITESLATLNKQANEIMLGLSRASEEEQDRLEAEIATLKERKRINEKLQANALRNAEKAKTSVQILEEELYDLADNTSQDIDALIRQASNLDDRNGPLDKLNDKLAELKLFGENLAAEVEELQITLLDESLSPSNRAELEKVIVDKQKELIEKTFEINAQENAINRAMGRPQTNRPGNRIEQLFGREVGGSLNFLGNMDNILGRGVGNLLHLLSGGDTGSNIFTATQDASMLAAQRGEEYDSTDALLDIVETMQPEFAPLVEAVKASKAVLEGISGIVSAMNNRMGKYIDSAAANLRSYYGAINANLYGYSDYATIAGNAEVLGGNTLVKQTDYLSQIASLSAEGIARDIESAAILQTIKDKTLTSFDVSNESLRRLIRLGNDQIYQSQFGLELQLKKVLNSTFKDSGYLSSLFDSVTDAIMDASVSQTGDITSFNSVVQTWLGAMYSSGLSSNVVNQVASGINALGSGNVSALAGNEATQRLFLLAMDRVGLDYADILQQGLSLGDTNQLLQSVVEYLGEIAGNTSDNLVLKSSYANLFNLSMTDMQAIQNLNQNMPTIASMAVNTSDALSMTQYAATSLLEANTSVSEKWDNFFENFQYSLGAAVAESSGLYSTWRVSSTISDLANSITGNATLSKLPVAGAAAKAAQLAAGAVQAGISVYGLLDTLGTLSPTTSSGSDVASLLNISNGNIFSTAAANSSSNVYSRTSLRNSSLFQTMSASVDTATQQVAEYKEETNTGKILEEIEKTIMSTEKGYAFAVSLEGMNNEVLRSFASIFADEDAMLKTFKGTNKTLEDNLFTYLNDNSSNKNSGTHV